MLGTGAISWFSRKQPVVTLSTTEAEFIATVSYACQGVWLRRILKKLGHVQVYALLSIVTIVLSLNFQGIQFYMVEVSIST